MNLFNRPYSIFHNIFSWIGLFIIHFLTLWVGNILPLKEAFHDALIFNLFFALITIGLWFIVSNNDIFEKFTIDKIITHFSSFVVSMIIWLFASFHTLQVIFSDNKEYLVFLEKYTNLRIFLGIGLYIINLLFFYLIKSISKLKNKEEYEKRIIKLLKETELEALKSQINPHFLFNSLNSIHTLTRTNPDKASEMILQLSDYMRYSLNQQVETFTTLDSELNNLEKYMSIEKIRFGNKLNYSLTQEENTNTSKIPPMLLQPLFENAIKHGLYSVSEGFFLHVDVSLLESKLKIEITNNFDINFPSKDRNGLGINNVKNRLLNIFGRADLITILQDNSKGRYTIILNIPQYGQD